MNHVISTRVSSSPSIYNMKVKWNITNGYRFPVGALHGHVELPFLFRFHTKRKDVRFGRRRRRQTEAHRRRRRAAHARRRRRRRRPSAEARHGRRRWSDAHSGHGRRRRRPSSTAAEAGHGRRRRSHGHSGHRRRRRRPSAHHSGHRRRRRRRRTGAVRLRRSVHGQRRRWWFGRHSSTCCAIFNIFKHQYVRLLENWDFVAQLRLFYLLFSALGQMLTQWPRYDK